MTQIQQSNNVTYTLRSAHTVIAVDVVDNILPSIQRAYLKHPVLFNTKTVILIGNVHSVTGQSSGHNGFLFERRSFSKHLNSLISGLRFFFFLNTPNTTAQIYCK